MMALPPGCTVTYSVWVDVDRLTDEMVEWYRLIGGTVARDKWYNTRGKEQSVYYVSYGKWGKRCHHHHNGTGGTRLHFHGDDASAASMFIMKFFDHITANNLQQTMERFTRETA